MDHAPALPRTSPRLIAVLIALAVVAIAVPLLVVLNAPRTVPVQPSKLTPPPQRVIPKAELPPVEPAEFVAVAPEDARSYNASIPFSTAPLLTARPFRVTGTPESIARANDCLAAGVLYEAGDDTAGQRAVAQVVLNRVRHPAFPKTICGVVFQGAERSTGCQFTFTCDGALARRFSEAAWKRASEVARMALAGTVDRRVGMATHYHTDWVVPYWSASLDKVSAVDTHLFFRWTGWWGTPPAFRGQYVANEPLIVKLKDIAPAHSAAAGLAGVSIDATAIAPAMAESNAPQPLSGDPNTFLVTLDPRLSPSDYPAVAIRACGDRRYCKLLGWADRADTPAAMPKDARTIERMVFSYLRDREVGYEKALWNCERHERPDINQCMKSRIFGTPQLRDGTTPAPEARRETLGLNGPAPMPETPELKGVRRGALPSVPALPSPN
jgi:hypothetical protein